MSFSNLIWGGAKAPTAGMFYISGITSRPETRRAGCSQLPLLLPSFQLCHLSPGEGGGARRSEAFKNSQSTRINSFSTGSRHQAFAEAEFPRPKYFIPTRSPKFTRAKVCLKTRRS